MSALTVYQGIEAVLRGIPGLQTVMLGEPTGSFAAPGVYTAYVRFERPLRNNPPANNQIGMLHTFAHRLMIEWVDNPAAEMQLLSLLDAIPDAIDADPRLGGRLAGGVARIDSGDAGFVTLGSVMYRVIDYTSVILEKRSAT